MVQVKKEALEGQGKVSVKEGGFGSPRFDSPISLRPATVIRKDRFRRQILKGLECCGLWLSGFGRREGLLPA